jgi:hypothetical protein
MSAPIFDAEQLSNEWSSKICKRLKELGVNADELNETDIIIRAFTKTAVTELSDSRTVTLPYSDTPMVIEADHAHQIIDLFLRGVNQVAKKLRSTGKPWSERKVLLEMVAWKIFNLAKLLVGFLYIPNPELNTVMKNTRDLQLMMKQTANTLLEEVERELEAQG